MPEVSVLNIIETFVSKTFNELLSAFQIFKERVDSLKSKINNRLRSDLALIFNVPRDRLKITGR